MNAINKWTMSVAALLLPLQVMAQSVTVGNDSGVGGDMIVLPITFVAGADIAGIDLDITFPDSQFSAAAASCVTNTACAGAFTNCDVDPAGTVNIIVAAGAACSDGPLGEISVTIDGAATPGNKLFEINLIGLSNAAGDDLDPDLLTLNDGNIEVLGARFSSNPTPAQGVPLGSVIQNDTNPMASVDISNSGAAGTTLTGTCSESADVDNVFSLSGDTGFSVLQGDPDDTVVVTCDSSAAFGLHTGEMSCTHNGDSMGEADPALYALSCTITEGPMPAYSSVPAAGTPIEMSAVEEGDPVSPFDIVISNSGDIDTTLTGTCGVSGDPQITVTDGAFTTDFGGPSDTQTLNCDSSGQGIYTSTLTCSHNGSNATAVYAVTCDIPPPGLAQFASTPNPDTTTDMTPGDTKVGDKDPTSTLIFFNNADPGDSSLDLNCSTTLGNGSTITHSPDISGGINILAGDQFSVDFNCDTTVAGEYGITYSCTYFTDGPVEGTAGFGGTAEYTYTCDVRDVESEVSENPASGTTITRLVSTGGTAEFPVSFSEDLDEGVDGELITCALDSGGGDAFTIVSPGSFPVVIPAGGSVGVTVEGTDPGGVESVEDVLRCTFFDSSNEDTKEGTEVFYNLVLQIGSVATFVVTKEFSDNNPSEVNVRIACDNGLPLNSSSMISEDTNVTFVVTSFESGELGCEIFEDPTPNGYTSSFSTSGDSNSSPTASSCVFTDVNRGNDNVCEITNTVDPVNVSITKDWIFLGSAADLIDDRYLLKLICDAEIVGGYQYKNGVIGSPSGDNGIGGDWYQVFYGKGSETFTAQVIPEYPTSHCWVIERTSEDAVETENNCGNLVVSAGSGASCTITNTVFFEGIPTLNQYGLAILVLLMLGVGMVGFRRFS